MRGNIHSMKLGAITSRAAGDPAPGGPHLSASDQSEAVDAATAEYRRLNLYATRDKLAVSGDVNRMIAAAIQTDPQWFWHGPDA
jgi:hypothetical protein